MVCLELKPRTADWTAQTNPLSYGGIEKLKLRITIKCRIFLRFPEQNTFCRSTLKTSTAGYIRGNPTLTAGPKRGPRFETFSRPFVSIVTTTTTSLRFNFLQQMSFARILKKFLQTDKADKILE